MRYEKIVTIRDVKYRLVIATELEDFPEKYKIAECSYAIGCFLFDENLFCCNIEKCLYKKIYDKNDFKDHRSIIKPMEITGIFIKDIIEEIKSEELQQKYDNEFKLWHGDVDKTTFL